MKICQICYEKKDLVSVTDGCNHRYCKPCINKYFNHSLNNDNLKIKCPFSGCIHLVKIDKNILYNHLTSRYYKLSLPPWQIQCSKYCCQGFINLLQGSYSCSTCNLDICKKCLVPHTDKSCQDEAKRFSRREKARKYIRCPLCKVYIKKYSECEYTRCTNCEMNINEGYIRFGRRQNVTYMDILKYTNKTFYRFMRILNILAILIIVSIPITFVYLLYMNHFYRSQYCREHTDMMDHIILKSNLTDKLMEMMKFLDKDFDVKFTNKIGEMVNKQLRRDLCIECANRVFLNIKYIYYLMGF